MYFSSSMAAITEFKTPETIHKANMASSPNNKQRAPLRASPLELFTK